MRAAPLLITVLIRKRRYEAAIKSRVKISLAAGDIRN